MVNSRSRHADQTVLLSIKIFIWITMSYIHWVPLY